MAVIRDHVARYLALYVGSDGDLANDEAIRAWTEDLASYVPAGVTEMAGQPPTVAGMVTLVSTLIYLTTVEHEIVGSGVWDYQTWRDGRRTPVDVYQRLMNANFNLNVARTPLMSDFSPLALDAPGAASFRQFRDDLGALQSSMDREAAWSWRIEPKRLKANINA
jgi:arachidonate 15-lipoxygenase